MNHPEWGEGPWNNEPDHEVWIDKATDLDCMINRGPSGAWCGYVGVGPDHPLHGERYDDVDVNVHGGLTYSDACQEDGEICHVPAEGRSHDIWWFGFDCMHWQDLGPGMEAALREARLWMPEFSRVLDDADGTFGRKVYRDVAYVKGEVRDLALQLKAVADG